MGTLSCVAAYAVNAPAVEQARRLIDARQYVLDSDCGEHDLLAHLDRPSA